MLKNDRNPQVVIVSSNANLIIIRLCSCSAGPNGGRCEFACLIFTSFIVEILKFAINRWATDFYSMAILINTQSKENSYKAHEKVSMIGVIFGTV